MMSLNRGQSSSRPPRAGRPDLRGPGGGARRWLGFPAVSAVLALAACHATPPLPVAVIKVPGLVASASADAGGPAEYSVDTGKEVQLDGSESTAGSGTLGLAWSFAALPQGSLAVFDRPSALAPRFTADVPGTYVVQLVARGDIFQSTPAQVTIVARACGTHAPTTGALAATPAASVAEPSGIGVPVQLSAPDVADEDNGTACGFAQTFTHVWTLFGQPAGSHARLSSLDGLKPTLIPDVAGDYLVQLVVTDSTGLASAPGTRTLTAGACGGNAPVINALSSSVLQPGVGTTLLLTADVSDADNLAPCSLQQTETYRWTLVSLPRGSQARLSEPASLVSPSLTPDVGGPYMVRLVVTDSTGRPSQSKDLTITASACGSNVPQPAILAPASASIGLPVQLGSTVTDEDITACSLSQSFDYFWALRGLPAGSQAQLNAPRAVNPSFTPDLAGTYVVELHVIDSGGLTSATVSTRINVSGCGGGRPSIDALTASPAAPISGQQVRVTPTVSDGDSACADFDPARRYAWSLLSIPSGSSAFLRDPSAPVAVFSADLPGVYQVAGVVTNAVGQRSDTGVLNVAVGSCGFAAPSLANAGASPVAPDPGTDVTLSFDVSDADAAPPCSQPQVFSFRWTQLARPPGSTAALSDPGNLRPHFVPDRPGGYQFSVTATDQSGFRSAPAYVTFQATSCGTRAPSVVASPASFNTQPGAVVQLGARPSDPDAACGLAQSFTYRWSILSAPGTSRALVSDPGSPAPTFTPDVGGEYSLQVVAIDAGGLSSAPGYVRLSARPCGDLSPVIGSLSATAPALGVASTLSAQGVTDANCTTGGAPLRYAWTLAQRPLDSNAALSRPTSATTQLVPDVAGSYQVSLVVTNGRGIASAPAYTTLQIAPCGSSQFTWDATPIVPTASEPGGAPITLPHAGSTVALAAQLTDQNPTCAALQTAPFSYRWALVARPVGSTAQLSSTAAAQPVFLADLPGDYQLSITVTDALGTVSPVRVTTVKVDDCGFRAPTASLSPATASPLQRQPVALVGSAATSDATCPVRLQAGPTTQLRWSVLEAPAGAGPVLTDTTGAANTFTAELSGRYVVALVAVGQNGLSSAPATSTVTVQACGGRAPSLTQVTTGLGAVATSRPPIGQPVTVTAFAADPDFACTPADTIAAYTFRALALPAGSAVSIAGLPQAGSALTFTPDVAGSYVLAVSATDATGLSSPELSVVVRTAECAPVVSAISGSGAAIVGQAASLSVPGANLTDACIANAQYTYQWSLLDAPGGSRAGFSAATSAATQLVPDLVGTYVVQVVVTDQTGVSSAPATLSIAAATCGAAKPVLTPGQTAGTPILASQAAPAVGDHVTLSVPNVDLTANGGCGAGQLLPLRWSWGLAARPEGSRAVISPLDSPAPLLTPDVAGTYLVAVIATDALGNESLAAFLPLATSQCGISAPTQPLVAVQQGGQTISRPPVGLLPLVDLTATAFDPDAIPGGACGASPRAQTVHYEWTFLSVPDGSAVASPTSGSATFSFPADRAGTYVVRAVAIDSTGLRSLPAIISIPTGECGPDATGISASTSAPTVGQGVTLDVLPATMTDSCVGGGPFVWSWSVASRPAGSAALVASTGQTATFVADQPGGYLLRAVVTDRGGFSTVVTKAIAAQGCTDQPTIGGTSFEAFEPGAGAPNALGLVHRDDRILLSASGLAAGTCSGLPSGGFTYSWSIASRPPGSEAVIADPSVPQASFVADVAGGTWQVALVVTDSRGNSSAPFIATPGIVASPCGTEKPLLGVTSSGATPNIGEEKSFTLTATPQTGGTCPPRFAVTGFTYAWSVVSQPLGGAARLSPPDGSVMSFAGFAAGSYQLQAVATASSGISSDPLFVPVTVADCGGSAPAVANLRAQQHRFDGAPARTAPPDGLDTNVGIALGADVTDPDTTCGGGGPIALRWTLRSKPAGSLTQLADATTANPTLVPDREGAWVVDLVATGANGRTTTAQLSFATTACGTHAPVATDANPVAAIAATQLVSGLTLVSSTLAPRRLAVGAQVALTGNVVDGDAIAGCGITTGTTLGWSLVQVPSGSRAFLDTSAGARFLPDVSGAYTVRLVASDALGLTGPAVDLPLTIDCNTAAPEARDGTLPAFSAAQTFAALDTSPPTAGSFTITHSTLSNPAPQLGFYPGQPVQIAAHVVDDDAAADVGLCGIPQTLRAAWSFARLPPGSAARFDDPTATATAFVPDLPGEYDLRLVLEDQSGNVRSQTFSLASGLPLVEVNSCGLLRPDAQIQVTAPHLGAVGAPSASAYIGDLVQLVASGATDPNAAQLVLATGLGCGLLDPLVTAWAFRQLPVGGQATALSGAATANASFTPPVDGVYEVTLGVSSGTAQGVPRAVLVDVRTPDAAHSSFTATPSPAVPVANGTDRYDLLLTVRNAADLPVPEVPVTFAPSGASTVLSPAGPQATDANGQIALTLTSTVSGYTCVTNSFDPKSVLATSGAFSKATATLAFASGPATSVAFVVQPGNALVDPAIIPGPPTVGFLDANLNLASVATRNVKLSKGNDPSRNHAAILAGTLAKSSTCRAVFSDLSLDKVGAGYTLKAVVSGSGPTFGTIFSNPFDVTSATPPPAAPTALTNTPPNVGQAVITWTAPAGAVAYEVYRDGGATAVGAPIAATFTDTLANGLVEGGTYSYEVVAFDQWDQASPRSTALAGVTLAPPVPTGISLTPQTDRISVAWAASNGATSYEIFRSTSLGGTYTSLGTVTPPATNYEDLDAAVVVVDYYYQVSATNAGGTQTSVETGPAKALVIPDPPTNLVAEPSDKRVYLSWTASITPGVVSYKVYRNTTATGTVIATVTAPAVTYTDPGRTNGTTYNYTVRATATADSTAFAGPVSATPTPLRLLTFLGGGTRVQAKATTTTTWTVSGHTDTLTFDPGAVDVRGLTSWLSTPFPLPGTVASYLAPRSFFALRALDLVTTTDRADAAVGRVEDPATTSQGAAAYADGALVRTGSFNAATTPIQGVSFSTAGGNDIFIARMTRAGAITGAGTWVNAIGGTGDDQGRAVAATRDGGALLAGWFSVNAGGVAFGSGITLTTPTQDAFLARFDASGTLLWARQATSAGTNKSRAYGVGATEEGGAIVVGRLSTGDTNTVIGTGGLTPATFAPTTDAAFIARYAPDGALLWARQITSGAGAVLPPFTVAVFADGSSVAAGAFSGVLSFGAVTDPGRVDLTAQAGSGGHDLFLARYSPDGRLLWARDIGNTSTFSNVPGQVNPSPDGTGFVFTGVIGRDAAAASTTFGDAGNQVALSPPASDHAAFTARYNLDASLVWAKKIDHGDGRGASFFPDGTVGVTGTFTGTAIVGVGDPTLEVTLSTLSAGSTDLYVARYNADGSVSWAQRAGANAPAVKLQDVRSAAATPSGDLWIAGKAQATCVFGPAEPTPLSIGTNGAFAVRYSPRTYGMAEVRPTGLAWARMEASNGAGTVDLRDLSAFSDGSFVAAMRFAGPLTLGAGDPSPVTLTPAGADQNVALARYGRDGKLVWAQQAGSTPANEDVGGIAALRDDSGVVVVGVNRGTLAAKMVFDAARLCGSATAGTCELAMANDLASSDFFAARFSASTGQVLWVRGSAALRGAGSGASLTAVAALPGEATVSAGALSGTATIGTTDLTAPATGSSAIVVGLAKDGTVSWARQSTNLVAVTINPFAVAGVVDGSAIVVGNYSGGAMSFGTEAFAAPAAGSLPFLVRYSAAGVESGGIGASGAGAAGQFDRVVALADGAAVISGRANAGTFVLAGTTLPLASFIARLQPDKTLAWARSLPGPSPKLGVLKDGTLAIAGFGDGTTAIDAGGLVVPAAAPFTAIYDATGSLLWEKDEPGAATSAFLSVLPLPAGGALFAGSGAAGAVGLGNGEANATSLTSTGPAASFFLGRYFSYGPFSATAP